MINSSPLLSVRNLKAYFKLDEGEVKAVDGVTFDVQAGQVFGIVGESGCGKSVTMKAILRIIDPPGQIVGGEIMWHRPVAKGNGSTTEENIDLTKLDANGKEMRAIRGAEIALIPQEPMSSFSPVHTIGNQLIEAIQLHRAINKKDARQTAIDLLRDVGIPMP
ncbi:MAG: ABC transporter ATP-binding protein, partial [Chloroflexi bacterium]|nr:ABC transporter ATP-binding protein [Chloroflexota bacterium]